MLASVCDAMYRVGKSPTCVACRSFGYSQVGDLPTARVASQTLTSARVGFWGGTLCASGQKEPFTHVAAPGVRISR